MRPHDGSHVTRTVRQPRPYVSCTHRDSARFDTSKPRFRVSVMDMPSLQLRDLHVGHGRNPAIDL